MSVTPTIGLLLCLLPISNGYPIDPKGVVLIHGNNIGIAVIGVSFLLTAILLVLACSCCRERRDGFKEFRNSTGSLAFTNALSSELSIFPPPNCGDVRGDVSPSLPPPPSLLAQSPPVFTKPAAFSSSLPPDISDWLAEPCDNFPRHQLFYQREIGKGWFGKVVEGEARGVKVVVRILREEATPEERAYFLYEAKPFRDLKHKNIVSLFSRCLHHQPYLLLFHLYSNGDLKSFLVTNSASRNTLNEQGICLRMMVDIAEGLEFMIQNRFIHTDLAARNCLVAPDLTVKIGDYGASIDLYKDEYYIVENVAIPLRWCAPETVHCTPTTIETKQVSEETNAWSLGVVIWEIAEFGKLPYHDLTDDQVIIRVFGSENLRLPQPQMLINDYLYKIMLNCWMTDPSERWSVSEVVARLKAVLSAAEEEKFKEKWESSKPNTVAIQDNAHTPIHSPRHTQLARRPRLHANAEFDSGVDLEIRTTPDSWTTGTPTGSEDLFFQQKKSSPSLTNLQGSLEELSWVGVSTTGEEDEEKFARNVSEAISHLDQTLAREATSSSSQDSEEETWRGRIERGEFTEKVREKSKSVTDLMVLTHIDSEGSETDSLPSLTRQGKGATFTSVGFGSEGNIRNAVLGEELQDRLRQLSLWKTDDPFLGLAASETNQTRNKNFVNNVNTSCTSEIGTSSQKNVPGIVVSEAIVVEPYEEPETNVDTEYLLKSVPRKLVFVCNDSDVSSGSSSPDDSVHSVSDITQVTFVPAEKIAKVQKENGCSVVLGSCEEHTLDYFKGLKTTFAPIECYSDEEDASELPDKTNVPSDLESPSSGAGMFDEDSLSDNRKTDCGDDLSPITLDDPIDSPIELPQTSSGHVPVTDDPYDELHIEPPNQRDQTFNSPIQELGEETKTDVNIESLQSCLNSNPFTASNEIYTCSSSTIEEKNISPKTERRNFGKNIEDTEISKNVFLSEFKMNDMITEDIFSKQNYDAYFSIDSGHSSDRCSDQDQHLNDLKNRLEDVANFGEDFQLKRSEEEYGGKLHTPDDERSSDSGFRDKGSLSESVEDTCDEKYNLEDIDAELDDFNSKNSDKEDFKYYEQQQISGDVESGWFLHPQNNSSESGGSGWLSQSTEDEEKPQRSIDDEFVVAIRNELTEKLPCAQQHQKMEEDSSPEQEKLDSSIQFNYPAQLSPILEEQESNQSSLILDDDNSPLFKLDAPKKETDTFTRDIIGVMDVCSTPEKEELIVQDLEMGKEMVFTSEKFTAEDDVLIIDTETNEATLIESPKPQSHLAFVMPRKINENFKEKSDDEGSNEDNSLGINSETYNLSCDNSPSTEGFSMSNSVSSSENGVLSGFFLSPCSIKSDLFDSGPPSLPFDLGQSIEEVEEICLCKPNNEAVEIEQELVDVGILPKEKQDVHIPDRGLSSDYDKTESDNLEVEDSSSQSVEPSSITADCLQISHIDNSEITSPDQRRDSFLDIDHNNTLKFCNDPFSTSVDLCLEPCDITNSDTKQNSESQLFPSGSDRRDLFLELSKTVKEDPLETEKSLDGTHLISAKDRRDLFLDLSQEKEVRETKILPSPEDRKHIFLSNSMNDGVCKSLTFFENSEAFTSLSVSDGDLEQSNEEFLFNVSKYKLSCDVSPNKKNDIPHHISLEVACENNLNNDMSPYTADCISPSEAKIDQVNSVAHQLNKDLEDKSIPNIDYEKNDRKNIFFTLFEEEVAPAINHYPMCNEQYVTEKQNHEKQVETQDNHVDKKNDIETKFTYKQDVNKEESVEREENSVAEENESQGQQFSSSKPDNLEKQDNTLLLNNEGEISFKKAVNNVLKVSGNVNSDLEDDEKRNGAAKEESKMKEEKVINNIIERRWTKNPRFEIIPVPEESLLVVKKENKSNLPEASKESQAGSKEDSPVEYSFSRNEWLRDLLLAKYETGEKLVESPLNKKDWPKMEELIPPNNKIEEGMTKNKHGITSTLALMSPDLSFSTDSSKSHSLLSSFSSTPTIDEKKFNVDKSEEEKVKPEEPSWSNGPLPSPEDADKGWRPTINQLLELVDQTEGEEMSTSFIEPDESGLYTPDWESDTSEEHSSSSSEFIWKPQENVIMERIEEEDEDEGSSSEGSEVSRTEFIPSMWDSTATPSKSALRTPNNVEGDKKKVVFKKEKYQCIYEYPREPSDSEDDEPPSWQAPPLSALADWELGEMEFPVSVEGDSDSEDGKQPERMQDYNIYQLNYNIGSHFLVDEGELYISGGGGGGGGSEFFPGRRSLEEIDGEWRPGGSDLGGLGELRHTKDTLRLELPSLGPEKGEASILDSGIDTSSTD